MAAGTGIYITWITGAILLSIAMMPLFRPPYAKLRLDGFIDMFRRYWAHMVVVFSVYLWKDLLDGVDRVLMANTQLDMTPYVYAIEGDIVLWVQQELRNAVKSGGGASAAGEMQVPFLGALPFDPGIVRGGDDGVHRIIAEPEGETAMAFNAIVDNVLAALEKGAGTSVRIT